MSRKLYSYENFDIDVNSSSMLVILVGISVGLFVGIALSLICRSVSGKVVSALSKSGATDEDSAKTVSELGLSKNPFVKPMLKPGSPLYKALGCTGGFSESKPNPVREFWHKKFLRDEVPMKFSVREARFYLPEEKRVAAELRFTEEKHPVRSFILSAVLITALCLFAVYAVPELLQMLDNLITQISAS